MGAMITHEAFVRKAIDIRDGKIDFDIVTKYQGAHKSVTCKCKKCDWTWNAEANNIIKKSSYGCPKCHGKAKYTSDEIICIANKNNPSVEFLEVPTYSNQKVLCRCKTCGHEWNAYATRIMNTSVGCPNCSGVLKKTHEQFIEEMRLANKDIDILSNYNGNKKNVLCKCKICWTTWEATPNALLRKGLGTGCPECKSSKGELAIKKFLKSNDIDYEYQKCFADCRDKLCLPFDFYIKSKNLIIEYDGQQHFYPVKFDGKKDTKSLKHFERTMRHDKMKNDYCAEHNINLIRIPYTEFNNIEAILTNIFT